ncbi:helix-turn-helix transcriptional regulator [Arsenophonus nasoniae]|uniref:AlpA family phage regulatory protein n=1 Tax=Arsenophonus nasoniae TaxID=638 RepID=A0AA95GGQ4_9GAMM|nr:AlpA family phage regulatory protein [Arsenophonus nasoniae]WGL93765.1 AlpA family phage regulatory protein [Arsenophonus nasoniae]WGL96023.1 AlpA family phage regulatory protein [Arsenophonus nasoniae]
MAMKFISPTPEERQLILNEYGEQYDRRIREKECKHLSSLSRSRRWQLEHEDKFPKRVALGENSVSWLLSDVLWWVRNPPVIDKVRNPCQLNRDKNK